MIESFGTRRRLQLPDGGRARPLPGSLRYDAASGNVEVGLGTTTAVVASAALEQPNWYIDATAGDDGNDGATPATALRTLQEWTRRIGSGRARVAMTVTVRTDLELDGNVIIEGDFPLGLTIRGEPTVVRTGVLTAVDPYDFTTLPGNVGTVSAAGGFAGDEAAPVQIVGGPRDGAIGWIVADLGGGQAQYGPFYRFASLGEVTPEAGDAFEILRLPVVQGASLVMVNPLWGFRSDGNVDVILEKLDMRGEEAAFVAALWIGAGMYILHSRINGHGNYFAARRPRFVGLAGCWFGGFSAGTFPGRFYGDGLLVACTWFETGPQARSADALVDLYATHVGYSAGGAAGTMAARQGRIRMVSGSVWAYYGLANANRGVVEVWEPGAVELGGKIGGVGNTAGYGIWVANGGRLTWPEGDALAAHAGPSGGTLVEVQVGPTATTYAAVGSSSLEGDQAAIYPAPSGP